MNRWQPVKIGGAKKPRRKPGTRWRLKVNDDLGTRMLGAARDFSSETMNTYPDLERSLPEEFRSHHTDVSGTIFDELVVDRWLHVEAMQSNVWWMNVGGVTLHVTVDRDGHPKAVSVHMPGSYDYGREGCTYTLDHEAHDPGDTVWPRNPPRWTAS